MEFWSGTAFMNTSALGKLWRGGGVSWSGQYYQVPELKMEPHPQSPAREPIERFAETIIGKERS